MKTKMNIIIAGLTIACLSAVAEQTIWSEDFTTAPNHIRVNTIYEYGGGNATDGLVPGVWALGFKPNALGFDSIPGKLHVVTTMNNSTRGASVIIDEKQFTAGPGNYTLTFDVDITGITTEKDHARVRAFSIIGCDDSPYSCRVDLTQPDTKEIKCQTTGLSVSEVIADSGSLTSSALQQTLQISYTGGHVCLIFSATHQAVAQWDNLSITHGALKYVMLGCNDLWSGNQRQL